MFPSGSPQIGNVIQQVKRMLMTADLNTVLSTVAGMPDFSMSLTNITIGGTVVKEVRLLGSPMIVIDLGDIRVGLRQVVKGTTLADIVKALSGYKSIYSKIKYYTCVAPSQYEYCTPISHFPSGATSVNTGYNFDVYVVKHDSTFAVDINTPDGYFHINGISINDNTNIYVNIFLSTVARFMPSIAGLAKR
jgi:hypothetical protein